MSSPAGPVSAGARRPAAAAQQQGGFFSNPMIKTLAQCFIMFQLVTMASK